MAKTGQVHSAATAVHFSVQPQARLGRNPPIPRLSAAQRGSFVVRTTPDPGRDGCSHSALATGSRDAEGGAAWIFRRSGAGSSQQVIHNAGCHRHHSLLIASALFAGENRYYAGASGTPDPARPRPLSPWVVGVPPSDYFSLGGRRFGPHEAVRRASRCWHTMRGFCTIPPGSMFAQIIRPRQGRFLTVGVPAGWPTVRTEG